MVAERRPAATMAAIVIVPIGRAPALGTVASRNGAEVLRSVEIRAAGGPIPKSTNTFAATSDS